MGTLLDGVTLGCSVGDALGNLAGWRHAGLLGRRCTGRGCGNLAGWLHAYHGLTGETFYFRAHPLGPAGTLVIINDKPDARGTWQVHGTPGFT